MVLRRQSSDVADEAVLADFIEASVRLFLSTPGEDAEFDAFNGVGDLARWMAARISRRAETPLTPP